VLVKFDSNYYLQQSQESSKKEDEMKQQAKREWKKQELARVQQGKKPFYLKKCKLSTFYLCTY
jgi:hypothetical protein